MLEEVELTDRRMRRTSRLNACYLLPVVASTGESHWHAVD